LNLVLLRRKSTIFFRDTNAFKIFVQNIALSGYYLIENKFG